MHLIFTQTNIIMCQAVICQRKTIVDIWWCELSGKSQHARDQGEKQRTKRKNSLNRNEAKCKSRSIASFPTTKSILCLFLFVSSSSQKTGANKRKNEIISFDWRRSHLLIYWCLPRARFAEVHFIKVIFCSFRESVEKVKIESYFGG